jgi:nucleoside-diphosphate-sugar epimerase
MAARGRGLESRWWPIDECARARTHYRKITTTTLVNGYLAAKAVVTACLRDPVRAFEVNVLGPTYILEACRELRLCSRLLICSTDHVFGPVPEAAVPLPEEHPLLRQGGPYDGSKAAMEVLVRCLYSTYREALPLLCLTRCANVFGYGDTTQRRVIPHLIHRGLSTRKVPLTTKMNGRQFLAVEDAAAGYILAMSKLGDISQDQAGPPEVPTFHFAIERYAETDTDRPFVRIRDLASMIADLTEAQVEESPGCVDFMPHENPVQGLSCARTRQQLGREPALDFKPAVARLVQFLRPETTHGARVRLIHDAVEAAAEQLVRASAAPAELARTAADGALLQAVHGGM